MAVSGQAQTVVVGAGPVGCVLAAILARRGERVTIYEKRADMRQVEMSAGRSINLVLTRRGLRALELLGLREAVLQLTVPVRGRMMHSLAGELTYQPYGKDDRECNYSISRGELNRFLLDHAERAGVQVRFEHPVVGCDPARGELTIALRGGEESRPAPRVFGCDGAFSAVRQALGERGDVVARFDELEHGYKELTFPAAPGGGFAMEASALHIWPRGRHMLMGLPNADGSFTGTVYLPWTGPDSFAELGDAASVTRFFETHYPDAIPLLGDFAGDFVDHPTGHLGTVRAKPWHSGSTVLLVGDAAHGIVPFFGQGLNCGFEDCALLAELLAGPNADDDDLFARYDARRKADADAIADMALDNFVEMRDKVGDPDFLLRKEVESRLERALPRKFRSRYAMVMYSAIPYHLAYEAGAIADRILTELCRGIDDAEQVDLTAAESLLDAELAPFLSAQKIDLAF